MASAAEGVSPPASSVTDAPNSCAATAGSNAGSTAALPLAAAAATAGAATVPSPTTSKTSGELADLPEPAAATAAPASPPQAAAAPAAPAAPASGLPVSAAAGDIASSNPAAGAAAGAPQQQQRVTTGAAACVSETSSKVGCLYWWTRIQPTNYDMLVFRTLNRDMHRPNHNDDYLAEKIRDELMPLRSWWIKHWPLAKQQLRNTLENKIWGVPGCINFIDARTKWFDGAVKEATGKLGIKQVVIVAAGYDTRAYRLAQPGVTFYEIDLPVASQRKQALTKKLRFVPDGATSPVYLGADLSQVDLRTALLNNTAFDPAQPTLFTVEGLIYYLPEPAAHGLIASISSLAAPGSRVYFDFMHAAALEGRGTSDHGYKYAGFKVTARSVANKGEQYRFGIRDSAAAVSSFLAPHGFKLSSYLSPRDMMAAQLPHVPWDDKVPPIAAFYSYASAYKP